MKKMIKIFPEKCTSCYICQLACSFQHTGECRPSASRISIATYDKIGVATPTLCLQCDETLCANICPTKAIKKNSRGIVVIDELLCIKCKKCIEACTFGNIKYDPLNKQMIKCDLCDGDPQCVNICPSGALIYTSVDEDKMGDREARATKKEGDQ